MQLKNDLLASRVMILFYFDCNERIKSMAKRTPEQRTKNKEFIYLRTEYTDFGFCASLNKDIGRMQKKKCVRDARLGR